MDNYRDFQLIEHEHNLERGRMIQANAIRLGWALALIALTLNLVEGTKLGVLMVVLSMACAWVLDFFRPKGFVGWLFVGASVLHLVAAYFVWWLQ